MAVDEARKAAADLATLVARDVDLCMRDEEATRHRVRVARAKAQAAQAELALAEAEWQNATELLQSARDRFGVAWPAARQTMERTQRSKGAEASA